VAALATGDQASSPAADEAATSPAADVVAASVSADGMASSGASASPTVAVAAVPSVAAVPVAAPTVYVTAASTPAASAAPSAADDAASITLAASGKSAAVVAASDTIVTAPVADVGAAVPLHDCSGSASSASDMSGAEGRALWLVASLCLASGGGALLSGALLVPCLPTRRHTRKSLASFSLCLIVYILPCLLKNGLKCLFSLFACHISVILLLPNKYWNARDRWFKSALFYLHFCTWKATHVLSNVSFMAQFQQGPHLDTRQCKCQIKHWLRRNWITVPIYCIHQKFEYKNIIIRTQRKPSYKKILM
jgi:hypothetical protein